jgi:hypothetical protein
MAYKESRELRKRENIQPAEQNHLLLQLIPSGEYAIAHPRTCKRLKDFSSDEYKDGKFVRHGYGSQSVTCAVIKIGPISGLKDYLNRHGLALPSDKENSNPSI